MDSKTLLGAGGPADAIPTLATVPAVITDAHGIPESAERRQSREALELKTRVETEEPIRQEAEHIGQLERAFDEGLAPPAHPRDYQFDYPIDGGVDRALDLKAREVFHAEGFDQGTARALVSRWNQLTTDAAKRMPRDVDLEVKLRSNYVALAKLWGPDAGRKLELANQELDRIAKDWPALGDMLKHGGLDGDPTLMQALVVRAERRQQRADAAKAKP